MAMAADVLRSSMVFYFVGKRPVPAPSKPKRGERLIELPPSATAKVLFLNEMLSQKVKHTDLAKKLRVPKSEITRLMDLGHTTKIDRIGAVLKALGKNLELSVS